MDLTCETPGCNNRKAAKGQGRYRRHCNACSNRRKGKTYRDRKDRRKAGGRDRAVAYLGGSCVNPACLLKGIALPAVAFDFHHRDPSTKVDTIARMLTRGVSWAAVQAELDKCDLLCAVCHRLAHASQPV